MREIRGVNKDVNKEYANKVQKQKNTFLLYQVYHLYQRGCLRGVW